MSKGEHVPYSTAERAFIYEHRAMTRRELHAAFVERFNRTDVTVERIKAMCTRNGWTTGRTGRFDKGHVPANLGKKMPFNENSARTQFKKGQIPVTAKPVGYERIDKKDGYVLLSIDETNPHTGYARRFVLKHVHLWEQKHGPVPKGMCLKCLDGDKTNCDPSNWEAVPRALLPRLNGRWTSRKFDDAPADLKPVMLATAKLAHAAKTRADGSKDPRPLGRHRVR